MTKRFTRVICSNDEYTGSLYCNDEPLKIDAVCTLLNENEQLKQQIKDLRLEVLDSLHDADDIQCSCNPCVVEECVKKGVE